MGHFDNDYYENVVIDFIDNPVRSQPNTVAILSV